MSQDPTVTVQLYSSIVGETSSYSRDGERYTKRISVPRRYRDMLVDIALGVDMAIERGEPRIEIRATVGHIDASVRILNILHKYGVHLDNVCLVKRAFDDGGVSFDLSAMIPIDGFPSKTDLLSEAR